VRTRPSQSLAQHPILIGAITVLVTAIALFLSYQANSGLPFVKTYDIHAVVPDAAELVRGNDVRIGGRMVGLVSAIHAVRPRSGGVAAVLDLKLNRSAAPLPADTQVAIRLRSNLGLKYVELVPGHAPRTVAQGGTLGLAQAVPNVDLDDVLNAFDPRTRQAVRTAVGTLGNAVATRGGSLNLTVGALPGAVSHLAPVARNLSAPTTQLDAALRGLDAAARAVAPVAPGLASLFDSGATTFGAIAGQRDALGRTIVALPATETAGAGALAAIQPPLADTAAVLRAAAPGARYLPAAAVAVAAALHTGTPVLARAGPTADGLRAALGALATLVRDPSTATSVNELTTIVQTLAPALAFTNPYQTQCNYLGLWGRNVSSVVSEGDSLGTWMRTLTVLDPQQILPSATPAADVHVVPYPDEGQRGGCEAGNEIFAAGQRIGPAVNAAPPSTEATAPPPGVAP
jgi:virulence factor Mce-like protein